MVEFRKVRDRMPDIFLGFVFEEEMERELLKISRGVQTAANQYQKGFLAGFGREMEIFSVLCVPIYSRGCRRLRFQEETVRTAFGNMTYVPFLNLLQIREYMQEAYLYRVLSRMLKETSEDITIYVYSLYLPFLRMMRRLKQKHGSRIRYCLIIPDLAGEYGIMRRKFTLRGIKDRLEAKRKMTLPSAADSYVFLTEAMREQFPPKPYTVIEGFLPQTDFDYKQPRIPRSILYTGSLNPVFGISRLLEAFQGIDDPRYQLWICGAGGEQAQVEAAAAEDPRITYYGYLPKQEIMKLQARCDILVNPRSSDGTYTKYSFPSKTMEYLLSGSKVVMYRLEGVGEEYYRFIRTIEKDGAEGIREALMAAAEDTAFSQERRLEQAEWIRTEKSAERQVSRICAVQGR